MFPNTCSGRTLRLPKILLAIVSLLGSASLVISRTPAAERPSRETISVVKRAVVIVTTFDGQGKPLLQGSGFFIKTDCIVTAMHVIKDAVQIRIKTFDGKSGTVQNVIATNENTDLALLHVENSLAEAVLQLDDAAPAEGQAIVVVSNPQGSSWKTTRGRVGPLWEFAGTSGRMQITAAIFPGSSGGPVVNEQGRVIGVAAMHLASADGLNFAVPAESLKTLQASTSVKPTSPLTKRN